MTCFSELVPRASECADHVCCTVAAARVPHLRVPAFRLQIVVGIQALPSHSESQTAVPQSVIMALQSINSNVSRLTQRITENFKVSSGFLPSCVPSCHRLLLVLFIGVYKRHPAIPGYR